MLITTIARYCKYPYYSEYAK